MSATNPSFDIKLPLIWQLIATFLFLSLVACDTINTAQDTGSTEVVLLFDSTDPMLLTPDYSVLQELYNFEKHCVSRTKQRYEL
jgi:hypothetical protein